MGLLILFIMASFFNSRFHYFFLPSRFLSILLLPIMLTAVMELMAFLILRASKFPNSNSPVKNALQISKFNRANFYLLILISSVMNLHIILSSYFMSDINERSNVYFDLLFPSFLLPGITIFRYRYGHTGWKLFPHALDTRPEKFSSDDDNLWLSGLIYHNREDPSILVSKRFCFGYSLNIGNPLSILVIATILIGTVIIPQASYFFYR